MPGLDTPTPLPPKQPRLIRRFSRAQLAAHLLVAVTFFVMLWTGLALYFPPLAEIMNRPLAKQWHLYASVALGIGLIVLILLKPRDFGIVVREVDTLDRADREWLRGGPRRLFSHVGAPEQGWLNAGQKLNTAVTLGLLVVLAFTGILLWLGEQNTTWRFTGTVGVHDIATLLIITLVSGHLYLALFNPSTRAAARGIVTGSVDREWAETNHGRWVRDIEKQDR